MLIIEEKKDKKTDAIKKYSHDIMKDVILKPSNKSEVIVDFDKKFFFEVKENNESFIFKK